MEPIVTGALIGAGASLLGGLFGRKSAQKQQEQSIAFQREFAQHGLRWKMEDAQRAGVHPVYAMGAAPASGGAIPIMEDPFSRSISDAGQQIGRAVGAAETQQQRAARHVNLQLANAAYAKDMAMAGYYDSLAARARQEGNQSAPIPDPNISVDPIVGSGAGPALGTGIGSNRIKLNPSEVTSYAGSDPSVAAGKDVTWKKFKLGPGREWWLPNAGNAGEALEAVSESWPMMYFVLRENMHRNPNFLRENKHLLPDIPWSVKQWRDALRGTVRDFKERAERWVLSP